MSFRRQSEERLPRSRNFNASYSEINSTLSMVLAFLCIVDGAVVLRTING